jgi:hypothetical protein
MKGKKKKEALLFSLMSESVRLSMFIYYTFFSSLFLMVSSLEERDVALPGQGAEGTRCPNAVKNSIRAISWKVT